MQNEVYIALGSNIEPRESFIEQAIDRLDQHKEITVLKSSPVYQTKPVGYTKQGQFLNMVILVETGLPPSALLNTTQTIEQQLGRERDIRFGPRTIDIDILLYGEEKVDLEQLSIPHPRMTERAFVLVPLCALNESLIIKGQTIRSFIDQLDDHELRGVELYNNVGCAASGNPWTI
ncbi:2-amino-4-hydroxy-6-hydroxymethyldihydropteridine diphosphokinase [Alkalibacillus silvisoli]|uniref:2-amino-4-hydroxy-6-hydroxymethyldihydropteridine diphosphokinase n=1 Tax=Alkalibacillus silvisoli TaxID=392823 RepID=A0ABP3JGH6_9BACI